MRLTFSAALALVLSSTAVFGGCARGQPALAPEAAGPARSEQSSARDRERLSITIYNANFGVVREVRRVKLGEGRVSLEYRDVAAELEPRTVNVKSLGPDGSLAVLEQNFRYDLLTPATLLDKYVGKPVRVYRMNETLGREEAFTADVLSVQNGSPVLRLQGEITYGFPGRIAFPALPPNLVPKPSLVWLLASRAPQQELEVSYLSRGLSWAADYVLVVDERDQRGDLTGWVTLANTSGASYENAELKLVAGDVQRVTPVPMPIAPGSFAAPQAAPRAPEFREEGVFEYHLYTLSRPTNLLDKEQKQVSLLEAHDVALGKKFIFYGAEHYFRGQYGQIVSNQKVGVYLDFKNERGSGLGMPLPKGIVRVYKADHSGARQFVGEDRIDHTPRDEKVRIKLGEAFDVVGDRKQTGWSALGNCSAESTWEISLRNHKDEAVSVEVYEPIGGDWRIVSETHPHHEKDHHTFTFDVPIPARSETKLSYRVQVRWC